MALFSQESLNDGVRKREVFGWAMYDFANSGYTTVVLTAVFGAYFAGGVAGNAPWATLAWTGALALSSALVMLTMPALGAFADLRAAKKRLLLFSTVGCVVTTLALARVGPGDVAWTVRMQITQGGFDDGQQRRCRRHLRGPFLRRVDRCFNSHALPRWCIAPCRLRLARRECGQA